MITIELTGDEKSQFIFILPAQGSIETLETVEKILTKCNDNDTNKIDLEKEELELVKKMIDFLDKNNQLRLESLSLVKKIMNITGV